MSLGSRPSNTGIVCCLVALVAIVGCALTRPSLREDQLATPAGPTSAGVGPLVQPKRCWLTFAVLTRPANDRAINESIWGVADELSIPGSTRANLQANGLRAGVVTGDLPSDVEGLFTGTGADRVDPYQVEITNGSVTPVALAAKVASLNLFMNTNGSIEGKTYDDATGFLSVMASQEGSAGLLLRMIPEIHHGPIVRDYGVAPTPSPYDTSELIMKNGQKEDAFRDLTMAVKLLPNQTFVIGCLPEKAGSLGAFLLTEREVNSERLKQKLLLVRGVRNNGPESALMQAAEAAKKDAAVKKASAKAGSRRWFSQGESRNHND